MKKFFKLGFKMGKKEDAAAKKAAADAKALADAQAMVDAAKAAAGSGVNSEPVKKKGAYSVAEGVSITTKKRTVLSGGEPISASDVSSAEAFAVLEKTGKIVKNK